MVKKKTKGLSRDETLKLLGSVGKGIIEIMKSGPGPRYALTTMGLYAIGRTCKVPCGIIAGIQSVNTIIAVSEVTEDSGTFSGITNGVLSGGSGVAAGVLMNDALADKCKCPKIIGGTGSIPETAVKETQQVFTPPIQGGDPITIIGGAAGREVARRVVD